MKDTGNSKNMKWLMTLCLLVLPTTIFAGNSSYAALLELFEDWRSFEQPPLFNDAPDYRIATTTQRHGELESYQARLMAFDIEAWSIAQQVDWHLVRAEMNGMDFNIRVLRSWARDPAFYTSLWTAQSDTPAHEGPTHHALIDLWTYRFPLDEASEARLTAELETIPPLLSQARENLIGNARELWIAGIKNIENQRDTLGELAANTQNAGKQFKAAVIAASSATNTFILWLEEQVLSKTGPSGIGKDNYTWQLQNVHLVPLTWEDEVALLKRELDRARSMLALEEHRNRDLPPLVAISSPREYQLRADEAVLRFTAFLKEHQVLPEYDYIEPALRAHTGSFVPVESRNFFATVAHYELLALWTHWYHWFDLARMEAQPHSSPIRRGPLLYNIFDSRSEGMATGFEEMTMHAGLFDDNPRAREVVWIMLAQRAARGLGSLYAQANIFTLKEARDFHVAMTPRGWMRDDLDLLGFEQLLYLRQPGYGTSYVTGKYLIERMLGEVAKIKGDDMSLAEFFAAVDEQGVIPVSLIHWQLTGNNDQIKQMNQ
jgi:hypothetical protein